MAVSEIVKFNGGPCLFAWRYPNDEFGTWTQLIVSEPYAAVLCKMGKPYDVFESGKYTLDAAGLPLLGKAVSLPDCGRVLFSAEIWYVNKTHPIDVKWGMATPVQLYDPKYGIFVPVRTFGQFGIRIADPKKFLKKLNLNQQQLNKSSLVTFFRELYLTKVKDAIEAYLVRRQIGILELNAFLDELSAYLQIRFEPILEEYGIRLIYFYISELNLPEDESAVMKLKEENMKRAGLGMPGYDIRPESATAPPEHEAAKPAVEASGGDDAGEETGTAAGASAGGLNENAGQDTAVSAQTKECPKCHAVMDKNKRFCSDCGFDTQKTTGRTAEVKCSSCGSALTKKTKFCTECGKKYNPCPKCGADLPTDGVECESCGYEAFPPCPSCGKPLEGKNLKFCPECGVALVKKCPGCDTLIKGSLKFCPECGEKLKQ